MPLIAGFGVLIHTKSRRTSNINGIYFDYDEDDKLWKITCMNPYVVFT